MAAVRQVGHGLHRDVRPARCRGRVGARVADLCTDRVGRHRGGRDTGRGRGCTGRGDGGGRRLARPPGSASSERASLSLAVSVAPGRRCGPGYSLAGAFGRGHDGGVRFHSSAVQAEAALRRLPGITWRPFERESLPAIADFYATCGAHDRNPERQSLAGLREFWDSARSRPADDTLVGREDGGRVVATAWASCGREATERRGVYLGGAVRPDRRNLTAAGALPVCCCRSRCAVSSSPAWTRPR